MGFLESSSSSPTLSHPFPDEGKQLFWKARTEIVNKIQQGREAIQKQINVENFQTCMEKDQMTTIGFITGIVASLVM